MALTSKFERPELYDYGYYFRLELRFFSNAHKSRVENILKSIGDVNGKRILDIGCGMGFILNILKKKGGIVEGFDFSEAAIDFSKMRFPDLKVKCCSLYDYEIKNKEGYYDIITALDVIEHISHPDILFTKAKKLLKDSGLLVISTDNFIEKIPIFSKIVRSLAGNFEKRTKGGRALHLIKEAESKMSIYYNINPNTHINLHDFQNLRDYAKLYNMEIKSHRVYLLAGGLLPRSVLQILPKRYRGHHQTIVFINRK